jgi:hypothetical protein
LIAEAPVELHERALKQLLLSPHEIRSARPTIE